MPPLDTVDLRLLRVFVAVVEAGGFAAAQARLDLSLATVSNHMGALEGRLGLRLCRRGRAGFALTEAGETVYAEARRLLGAAEGFGARVGALRDALGGVVRLGALDAMVGNPDARIAQALAAFAERAPACAVRLVCRPPDELLRDVLGGALDAAVGSFPRVALGLEYQDLFEERQLFYAGRGHPLFDAPDEAVDHDAVARCRIVARSYWGARDVRGFASARVGAEVQDMESEAHLILSGAFLGHLPEHYAAQWVAAGRMRALAPGRLGYRAPFQIAVRPDRAAEPRVAALLDCLRAAHGR